MVVPKSQDPATDNANNNVVDTSVVDNQTHDESPEKLSLKARLKLFEKEIEQQGSTAPVPRTGKSFSPRPVCMHLPKNNSSFVLQFVHSSYTNLILFLDKKFSFLNADELAKMKEEEGMYLRFEHVGVY